MTDTSKQGQLGTCDLSITRHTYESCCNYHGEARWTWKPERAKPRQYMCNSCGIESPLEYCGKCGRDAQPILSAKQMREDFERRLKEQSDERHK